MKNLFSLIKLSQYPQKGSKNYFSSFIWCITNDKRNGESLMCQKDFQNLIIVKLKRRKPKLIEM